MGFNIKKAGQPAQEKQRVLELKVMLATPANHTQQQDQKAISDLNTLLSNITLEELALLAAFVKDPAKKEMALKFL